MDTDYDLLSFEFDAILIREGDPEGPAARYDLGSIEWSGSLHLLCAPDGRTPIGIISELYRNEDEEIVGHIRTTDGIQYLVENDEFKDYEIAFSVYDLFLSENQHTVTNVLLRNFFITPKVVPTPEL